MTLYLWTGLDIGGEYADAYIGVIAAGMERAIALVESDDRDWIQRYAGECRANRPETLPLHPDERSARVWIWG